MEAGAALSPVPTSRAALARSVRAVSVVVTAAVLPAGARVATARGDSKVARTAGVTDGTARESNGTVHKSEETPAGRRSPVGRLPSTAPWVAGRQAPKHSVNAMRSHSGL